MGASSISKPHWHNMCSENCFLSQNRQRTFIPQKQDNIPRMTYYPGRHYLLLPPAYTDCHQLIILWTPSNFSADIWNPLPRNVLMIPMSQQKEAKEEKSNKPELHYWQAYTQQLVMMVPRIRCLKTMHHQHVARVSISWVQLMNPPQTTQKMLGDWEQWHYIITGKFPCSERILLLLQLLSQSLVRFAPGLDLVGLWGEMDSIGIRSCHCWTVTLPCSNLQLMNTAINQSMQHCR